VRAELDVALDTRLVVTIGRLDPTKSHELFIRAAADVLRTREDVLFVVVGGGALLNELHAEVAATGRPDRIRLLGEREDITRLLAATDVYVRPGVVEGFIGITVLEAQVLGVPCVAFETQDVKLAVEPGITGVLVPPGDTAALAAEVSALLDAPDRAATLGAAGRARALARYGLPAVVDRLEELYEQLASGRRRSDVRGGEPTAP
jgi:glycosyltransferase involved in cell wall biosynthesis